MRVQRTTLNARQAHGLTRRVSNVKLAAAIVAACAAAVFAAAANGATSTLSSGRALAVPDAAVQWKVVVPAAPLTGVSIAIVDTGVTAIPSLMARMIDGVDLSGAGATADGNGHGTAMASIATGATHGVCRICTIMPVRVIGNAGLGTTQLATEGVVWATAHGARVINLSLTTSSNDQALAAAITKAVDAGIVVVVAAGNAGSSDPAAQGYPGADPTGAISVASSNGALGLYPWSNFGSWVQLAAPGSLTASTTTGRPFTAIGTSGSAAYVSGIAGLMLSCDPQLTPAAVQAILESTGTPLAALGAGGHIVDATAAVAAASPSKACQAAAKAA